jgi:hypothetical protein
MAAFIAPPGRSATAHALPTRPGPRDAAKNLSVDQGQSGSAAASAREPSGPTLNVEEPIGSEPSD